MSSFTVVQCGCGVVGLGYLRAYSKVGFKVYGIEANKALVEKYNDIAEMYHISDDMSKIQNVDAVMLSILTPLRGKKLDLTYLWSSLNNVATIVKASPKAYVAVRSTVPPGTSRKYKADLEALTGFPVRVVFQPEFLRDKTAAQDALNPWHVVIGRDENEDVESFRDLYRYFVDDSSITEMSIEEAEYLKMIHNSFNAAKISFFNQCKLLIDAINDREGLDMDINVISKCITKTCEGLMNPRYGTKAGHGYYGSCLPKDSAELASLEEEYGLVSTLFREVVVVNNITVSKDDAVVLHGDHQMDFDVLKTISSSDLLNKA
jgi:UDPglucose 6-dehydrogenase